MSNFFTTILYEPIYNLLVFLAWLIPGHSVGWVVIALTLIIRLILFPLSLKAAKAQARIRQLQPEINAIRAKHKDHMAQSQALMALYKREGISQFGACLPVLIQFPVLIVLYRVLMTTFTDLNSSLLYSFTPRPEKINSDFFGLDLSRPEVWLLPITAAILQFWLSKMTAPLPPKDKDEQPDPAQMMMKQMLYIFPAMTFFLGRMLPAAISIYWVVTTLFSALQQWYVEAHIKSKYPINGTQGSGRRTQNDVKSETRAPEPEPKRDLLTRLTDRRLNKQEKKTGVEVTIRKKS